jgi:hypothetical protein
LADNQLEESYNQLIHFSRMLPALRKTNRETARPLWTDRVGDYQKDLGIMAEICQELLADISARINNPQLMEKLFRREV